MSFHDFNEGNRSKYTINDESKLPPDNLPQVFYPWRRFFARTLDFFLYDLLWMAFIVYVFHVNLSNISSLENTVYTFIVTVIMLFLEPIWLSLFGTTPGKAILGLHIRNFHGKNLTYQEAFKRTKEMIGLGLGYSIPFYALWRLWKSYKICSENKIQPWDEFISYTLKDRKTYRNVMYVVTYGIGLFILFIIFSSQLLPPNRGNLTSEKFVENFNYYANYFDISFGNQYMDESGVWVEKEFTGTVYINTSYGKQPEYSFTEKNGFISEVSFTVELENNKEWIHPFNSQMTLASLSFVGAQKEVRLFSKIPNRIIKKIENNPFTDFQFTEAGVIVTCDIEYSGYEDMAFMLVPSEDDESETYFYLHFSVMLE